MPDDRQLEEAFERGRQLGRREQLAVREIESLGSWLPGARLTFRRSLFDSFVEYERDVTDNLRIVQRARWLQRTQAGTPAVSGLGRNPQAELQRIEETIKNELNEVRAAVDAELEEGRGRRCTIEAMRASPQRPTGVTEYPELDAFVDEDRRRNIGDGREDAGGADFGLNWQLENPFRRWERTRWRISWLCDPDKFMFGPDDRVHGEDDGATSEVYALEFVDHAPGQVSKGRVWLLGKLPTRAAVDEALEELSRYGMRERNSLIAAARAVARIAGPRTS